jgi:hypothetical protein
VSYRHLLGPVVAHGSRQRPAACAHAPLLPFDPSDSGGIVHTVLPPEQVIPPHFTDPTWLRGDFSGVTLDTSRWGGNPPFLNGANSTPLAMLMTPMLPLYPRKWQDACLTEHAERGYDDFTVATDIWNAAENGQAFSDDQKFAWCQYVHSTWGFRIVLWRAIQSPDALLDRLLSAGLVSFLIHGEEVDGKMTSQQYEASLQEMDRYIGGRIPIGVHFTADGARHMGYPIGFPRDTFLNDWSPYNGRVHLCQQLDVDASAGLQGASMYYARLHVNCGVGDAAHGPGAPDSRVIAFETSATAQLYGRMSEVDGVRRSWELICGTRDNPRCRPVSGSDNGLWLPNGDPS